MEKREIQIDLSLIDEVSKLAGKGFSVLSSSDLGFSDKVYALFFGIQCLDVDPQTAYFEICLPNLVSVLTSRRFFDVDLPEWDPSIDKDPSKLMLADLLMAVFACNSAPKEGLEPKDCLGPMLSSSGFFLEGIDEGMASKKDDEYSLSFVTALSDTIKKNQLVRVLEAVGQMIEDYQSK